VLLLTKGRKMELVQKTSVVGLIKPNDMNFVSKPWGYELWICNSDKYCGKKLFIKQGRHLSYHHHKIKDEVLYVESGQIRFTYDDSDGAKSIIMPAGYAFHVLPGVVHQMQAISDTMLLEFSTQHFDDDSYRVTRDLIVAPIIEDLTCTQT